MATLKARRKGVDLRDHPLVKGASEPFRSIATLAAAKDTAEMADAAAQAMAEHCDRRIEKVRMMFGKIQEAACDGRKGSATYALDRLVLIEAIATTALQKLEKDNRTQGSGADDD